MLKEKASWDILKKSHAVSSDSSHLAESFTAMLFHSDLNKLDIIISKAVSSLIVIPY